MTALGEGGGDDAETEDRAGDELREKGEVAGVVTQAVHRLDLAAIDVDQRADGVEGEEGDAQRQRPAHVRSRRPAQTTGQPIVVLAGEAEIFPEEQGRQRARDTQRERGATTTLRQIGPAQAAGETETP